MQLPAEHDDGLVLALHALAHPVRLAMLRYVAQHPGCICNELVVRFDRAQATVSQHLALLRRADLVRAERDGQATCYHLNRDRMAWVEQALDTLEHITPES